MADPQSGLEDLKHIREIMERSSTFLSLSGFSGVIIGSIAIIAGIVLCVLCGGPLLTVEVIGKIQLNGTLRISLILLLTIALLLAIASAFLFSLLKAKKKDLSLFNKISLTFAAHLFMPLISGGIFIIALYMMHDYALILPSMLIFYGLSLFSASKFTVKEVGYFGISVIILGLLATLFIPYALMLWTAGFGLFTMGYGLYIHAKYDK